MNVNNFSNFKKLKKLNTFKNKSKNEQLLICQALDILEKLEVPLDDLTPRQREKAAMALCAVGDVKKPNGWKKIKDDNSDYFLTTREIIEFYNAYFEENLSSGSYDDIRRKDLDRMLIAEIVVKSKPKSNISNPTRGYKINSIYSNIIRNYGQSDWNEQVKLFNASHPTYLDKIHAKKPVKKLNVTLANGENISLKDGEHNMIQKSVVEKFLPQYGNDAEILYMGDSDNKYGVIFEKDKLLKLGFADLEQNKLPDIIAYSKSKDWIYMIEAYHTSNPITNERKYRLEQLMGDAADKAVFVTAFENNSSYKKCCGDLAWETEVWIATSPNHMIHLNGSRFMGPYSS